jgi:DNA-binding PadR family transcriptional regulator
MHKQQPHSEGGERRHPRPQSRGSRGAFGGFPRAFGPPWAGTMGFGGRGRGRGPGGRARRGDVRTAVLTLLSERPMHGYEVIQELADRTHGVWKVSPGSVYPTLQLLEDEGLVVAEEQGGKRRYSLTDTGRSAVEELPEGKSPWEEVLEGVNPAVVQLRETTAQLLGAVVQIGQAGTTEQQGEAMVLLDETRRRLYGILAAEA